MQNPLPHTIAGNTFWVFPERCLFWEDTATLIIADLHLGKTGHFRKAGIGVPQTIYKADLQRLMAMLYLCKANRLIIVGDFTHSTINKEMELFLRWRKDFSSLHIDLIKGNHDILEHEWEMQENGFVFRHETKKSKAPDTTGALYTFTGHVHPGIVLKGTGKQSLKLPCFYFTPSYCILPAFSRFTGMYTVHPAKGEVAYASTDTEIIRIG
jgi:uncharacterized protein